MKFSFLQNLTLQSLARALDAGLRRLTFENNFKSQVVSLTIPPNSEVIVPHTLGATPRHYLVTSQDEPGSILKGSGEWNARRVTLKNVGPNTVNILVVILLGEE